MIWQILHKNIKTSKQTTYKKNQKWLLLLLLLDLISATRAATCSGLYPLSTILIIIANVFLSTPHFKKLAIWCAFSNPWYAYSFFEFDVIEVFGFVNVWMLFMLFILVWVVFLNFLLLVIIVFLGFIQMIKKICLLLRFITREAGRSMGSTFYLVPYSFLLASDWI